MKKSASFAALRLNVVSVQLHTCSEWRVSDVSHGVSSKIITFVLEVVIATLCKCLAGDKSSSLFGIKQ